MAPLFSILLPTHNRADVLPFAIHSVLAQTTQDFELLIVGDGCTDQTADVVRSFSDPRIQWFDLPKAPNFGYANRNIVLRQARGEYIAFMAHDDLWLPDHLELLLPFLKQPGIEFAYSRPLFVIPEGMIAPGTFNLEYAPTLKSFLAKEHNWIPAGCVVHRRECFAKYGYWDEDLSSAGDLDMWTRIIQGGGGKNFAYLAEPTCLHFRANWRGEITFDIYPLYVWKHFHALEGFVPEPLKIPVVGVTEQEAVWQVISADPENWPMQMRAAVLQALDQRVTHSDNLIGEMLTYRSSFKLSPVRLNQLMIGVYEREAALQAEIAVLNQQITELLKREADLQANVAALNQQNSALLERGASLQAEMAGLNQQITELLEHEAALQAEIAGLNQQIAELLEYEAALQANLATLSQQNSTLLERQAFLKERVAKLSQLLPEGSLAWKLIHRLRAIKRRLMPSGTRREKAWLWLDRNLRRIF